MIRNLFMLVFGLGLACGSRAATTYYVDRQRPDDGGDGKTWATAKRTIQAAVDLASASDTVLVRPGVYDEGSRVSPNHAHNNRLVCTKNITIESTAGAEQTTIMGARDPANPSSYNGLGPNALRCVYMSKGVLKGFTINNGATDMVNLEDENNRGGGLYAPYTNYDPLIIDCIFTGNASMRGGGIHSGTLRRCYFDNNYAQQNSAAIRGSFAHDCIIVGSSGSSAIGWATIYNCTLADNQSTAVIESTVYNSIISGTSEKGKFYNCCFTSSPVNPVTNDNAMIANPLFVNQSLRDYRLADNSPCLDCANLAYVPDRFGIDFNHDMRMQNGAVDLGALEHDWRPAFARALDADGVVVDEITPFVMYDEDVNHVNGSALLLNGWAARTNGMAEVSVTIPWQVPFGRSVKLGYEVTGSGTLKLYEGATLLETAVLADGHVQKKIFSNQQRPFPLKAVYTVGANDMGGALLDGFAGFGGLLLILR